MNQRVFPAVAVGAVLALSACSDSALPFETGGVAQAVESIRLSRSTVRIPVGESLRLAVDGRTRAGSAATTTNVRWRVEDPSVAVVDEDGLIVPLRAGRTVVHAVSGNNSASARVESVGSATPTKLSLSPDPVAVAAGEQIVVSGDLTYSNGKRQKLRTSYEWRSVDTAVATVTAGRVRGVAAGSTVVVASISGLADTVEVTVHGSAVVAEPAPAVTIAVADVTVEVGKMAAPEVTVSDGSDAAELGTLTWSSSAPAVATVGSDGIVTGVAAGTATIRVTVGDLSATSVATVTAPAALTPPATTDSTPTTSDPTAPAPTAPSTGPAGTMPELPRVTVDVTMPAVTGRTIRVNAGESLQAAIDAAQLGDEIVLQAGATFVSPTILRRKSGTGWITIRTSGTLPPAGTRVTPAHAPQMARLVPFHASETALRTEPGAHHYRLVGLEITGKPGETWAYTLVALGDGSSAQNSLDKVPHHLVLDRVYIHGAVDTDLQRCVGLNSGTTAIIDSYLADCHGKGKDTQAIGGWNGPGPFKIVNNYLAGAGENVMFGGADPWIQGLTPSDIEIRRNHIHKPLEWRGRWTVKNLFELKHAQRVLFEGNVLENNWVDAQSGFAVQLTPLSDNNRAPWTKVMDVTFRHNVVRNSPAGINVSARNAYGTYPVWPEEPASRIQIANNLLVEIGLEGQNGRLFQLLNEIRDLRIEHNTGLATHSAILFDGSRGPQERLVVANNILAHGRYGFFSSKGQGSAALAYYAPDAVVTGNVLIGSPERLYPTGNFFPAAIGDVGFVNAAGGDYRLSSSSPYWRADGSSPGVNFTVLSSMTAGAK